MKLHLVDWGVPIKWTLFIIGFLFITRVEPLIAESKFSKITILVPAERGGGWDLTAKAMAEVLMSTGGTKSVEIEYSPGAGGLIGLAQFISAKKGRGNALMVGGMFTVGAVGANRSIISLLDTTPLARLTLDNAVVAVPVSSSIKTADDLIETLISAPESISWVGGSKGGADETMLMEVAQALGISQHRIHYSPLPGGGEVGNKLASGKYTAGISGYSEFEELIENGQLRLLAVVTRDRMLNIDAPSFEELGIKINRRNWRGVFAPPDINATQLSELTNIIKKMVESKEWKQVLRKNIWKDAYLPNKDFTEFVTIEQTRAAADSLLVKGNDKTGLETISNILVRRYVWALVLGVLAILLVAVMYYQRSQARHREEGLLHAFQSATGEANLRAEELEKALAGIQCQIEQEFSKWELSSAERDIALLMLKGLRLKEIADLRGTSERTVRQQAQAVYKKAGLEGRSDLAAYFIEDFMQSMELRQEEARGQDNH